jgi:hypothetical protein
MKVRVALVFGAGLAIALTGCSSSGGGNNPPTRSSVPGTTAATTPGSSTPSSPPAAAGCAAAVAYCDTFDDKESGWPQVNQAHYYANYDSYQGGTYRVGERTNAAISQDAPYDISKAASDYSVQVDVDATPGQQFAASNRLGIVCWEHAIPGGGGATSAFLLQVSESRAYIGLWDSVDGSYHELKSAPATDALNPSGTNHLTAQCLQGSDNGSATAQMSLSVNGAKTISVDYAKSAKTYEWAPGASVGVLAIGEGSDIFYDNFAVTGKCSGDFC